MGKNLLAKIGGLVLAGSMISGCETFYPGMRYDDKGLGAKISEDLNGKDKTRYVTYDILTSMYKFGDKEK